MRIIKKYILLCILMLFSSFVYAQYTTYDNSNIFGEYHLVYNQTSPFSNNVSNYNTCSNYNVCSNNLNNIDNALGSGSVSSDDGTVIVSYSYERDSWLTYTVYVYYNGVKIASKTITQWIFGIEESSKNYAKTIANEKAAEKRAVPIGDSKILLLFLMLYIICKLFKNHNKFNNFLFI